MYRIIEQLYDAPIGMNSIQPGQNPEIESSRAFDKFKYGFHLGVLMMMEIMESYEDMLA